MYKNTYIGKKDIYDKEIISDIDTVKFKYRPLIDSIDEIELIGVFAYDAEELRYQINIDHDCKHFPEYFCLWYQSARMSDFEIISRLTQHDICIDILNKCQEQIDPEIASVIDDNLWDCI